MIPLVPGPKRALPIDSIKPTLGGSIAAMCDTDRVNTGRATFRGTVKKMGAAGDIEQQPGGPAGPLGAALDGGARGRPGGVAASAPRNQFPQGRGIAGGILRCYPQPGCKRPGTGERQTGQKTGPGRGGIHRDHTVPSADMCL